MAQGRTAPQGRGAWQARLLTLSPATLALASVLLAAADWGTRLAGDSVFPGGPLDEIAHLLTTLLMFWALGPRIYSRFLVPALIAAVAIDADHIPGHLNLNWLTTGTPRPYTHSLLTIVIVLAISALGRRRRDLAVGVTIGLAIHFWRDMAEGGSGVSLLWPVSYHSFQYPHGVYAGAMTLFVLIGAARCRRSEWLTNRRRTQRRHTLHSGQVIRTPEET